MNLKPKQQQAAALLGNGKSPEQTALMVQVSASTLRRWRQDPEFKLAVNRSCLAATEAIAHDLRELQSRSVEVLWEVLSSTDKEMLPARARTARWILEHTGAIDRAQDYGPQTTFDLMHQELLG